MVVESLAPLFCVLGIIISLLFLSAIFSLRVSELNSNIKSGYVTTGEDGSASVLFDQSFGSAPRIICQLLGTSDRIIICKTTGITSTGFTVKCLEKTDAGNSAVSGAVLHWIAVRP